MPILYPDARYDLVDQPTAAPTRKMAAVGISGAAVTALIWICDLWDIEMPEPVAAALVMLISCAVGYMTRERR